VSIDTLAEAQDQMNGAIDLRRKLHANPELGLHLPETTEAVLAALADLDLEIRRSQETTGFVATLQGAGNGPRIMLRGDMDALPMPENNDLDFASRHDGRMHACGHDAHTAMLMGAARLLHQHKDEIKGSIDFFFQTGEEGFAGARICLDEGLFDSPNSPDAVFAQHITPLLPVGMVTGRAGPLLAAADFWEMTLTGKGGHGSMPHDCIDPIPVACEIVQAMQSFVTRRINAFDPVVLSVTKIAAGTTTNVIPETAELLGTLRSTSEKARQRAHEGIERLVENIAAAHELTVDYTMNAGYPVTVNDAEFTEFARQTVVDLLGEDHYLPMSSPMMGAEDFSYFLQKWPGAMLFLGVKPEDASLAAPCHSNRMMLNEDGMQHGIALHASIALNYLRQATAA
jgi:hippurate hydrolase